MRTLGVIPARGGSKGVANKNARSLAGRPLIVHTIETAIKSGAFEKIVVTTDSEEIRQIAISAGAEAPFLREASLATDAALAVPVIQDAVRRATDLFSCEFEAICMLQPTTPLRSIEDCKNVVEIMAEDETLDSVISIVEVSQHPYKMVRRSEHGLMQPFLDWPIENPPRQSLPKIFTYNGAFYLTRKNVLMESATFKGQKCYLYEMPLARSVNIDHEIDFSLAEVMILEVN